MSDTTEYADAWGEDEQDSPAQNAVTAAAKKAATDAHAEYVSAFDGEPEKQVDDSEDEKAIDKAKAKKAESK